MELVIKKQKILKWLRYLGLVFGAVMYWVIYKSLGEIPAVILGFIAGIGFFAICDYERRSILFDYIADSIKSEITKIGELECHIEIKMLRIGLIIRVYLVRAGDQTGKYSKAIVDAISKSWYRQNVWITQVVGIDNESDIKEAEADLNNDVIKEIEKTKIFSRGAGKMFSREKKEDDAEEDSRDREEKNTQDKDQNHDQDK